MELSTTYKREEILQRVFKEFTTNILLALEKEPAEIVKATKYLDSNLLVFTCTYNPKYDVHGSISLGISTKDPKKLVFLIDKVSIELTEEESSLYGEKVNLFKYTLRLMEKDFAKKEFLKNTDEGVIGNFMKLSEKAPRLK